MTNYREILSEHREQTDELKLKQMNKSYSGGEEDLKKRGHERALESKLHEFAMDYSLERFMEARDLEGITVCICDQNIYSAGRVSGSIDKNEEPEARLKLCPQGKIIFTESSGNTVEYELQKVTDTSGLLNVTLDEQDRKSLPYVTDDFGRAFVCTKGTLDNPDNNPREDCTQIRKGELLARRYQDWQMLDETPELMEKTLTDSLERAARKYKNHC